MLRSLHIQSLFGIYTYDIDMLSAQGPLRFITSPNGFGKTTILSLIHALFSQDWDYFRRIPFQEISFTFDDSVIEIKQNRYNERESNRDDEITDAGILEVRTKIGDKISESKIYNFGKSNPENKIYTENEIKESLQLLPNIGPCYFIHDNRLQKINITNLQTKDSVKEVHAVDANADNLSSRLTETKNRIQSITTNDLVFTAPIEEKEYQNACIELGDFISKLLKYGLLEKNLLTEFRKDNAVYLGALVNALKKAYEEIYPFVLKLALFSKIVKRSEFAYKHMEIQLRYGYRFVADNETHTILETNKLSSGEQHLLIMAYELLFAAPEESLILLDEPELSFHYAWQSKFLYNLLDILALRPKLQWIVCTHSPQIFGRKWDLSVDLFELQNSLNTAEEQV